MPYIPHLKLTLPIPATYRPSKGDEANQQRIMEERKCKQRQERGIAVCTHPEHLHAPSWVTDPEGWRG